MYLIKTKLLTFGEGTFNFTKTNFAKSDKNSDLSTVVRSLGLNPSQREAEQLALEVTFFLTLINGTNVIS